MPVERVVVVSESPSLGASVNELLQSDHLDSVEVPDLAEAERRLTGNGPMRDAVLVVAANRAHCATVHSWPTSSVRELDLVVVGDRDLSIELAPRLHIVPLPLDPFRFLHLVRTLLTARDAASAAASDSANPAPSEPR